MHTQQEACELIRKFSRQIERLYPNEKPDAVLFGSYARGEAEEGSDIDVLYLVDAPRSVIAEHAWQVGSAAADLLLEHGVLISPIVENRAYFAENAALLPFFRNIEQEGVRLVG
jgi:predicted nucleotidyltransferase